MARLDSERSAIDRAPDHLMSRGILTIATLVAHYYTSEPSPDRWIAVGTVMFWPEQPRSGSPRWMLVGLGATEREAVADLRIRLRQNEPPSWKIKCDPPSHGAVHHRPGGELQKTGDFVVPWEIGADEGVLAAEFAAGETPLPLS